MHTSLYVCTNSRKDAWTLGTEHKYWANTQTNITTARKREGGRRKKRELAVIEVTTVTSYNGVILSLIHI